MIQWEEAIQSALWCVSKQLQGLTDGSGPYIVYLYGANFDRADDALVNYLYSKYPTHYEEVLRRKGKTLDQLKDHVRGHFAADCSGFICAITEAPSDMSSGGLWKKTTDRTTPVEGPEASLLWKNGHVGLDIGTGYLVEMVEEFEDLRVSRIRGRDFTGSGRLPWVDYTGATNL